MERASDEKPMRVHTEIKTAEEIQTGLVQGESGSYRLFLSTPQWPPKKGMQKSLPSFVTALYSSNWKTRKGNAGYQKGVAFLHGNETHSRVSFYFRPFFVRVVVHKLYTIT